MLGLVNLKILIFVGGSGFFLETELSKKIRGKYKIRSKLLFFLQLGKMFLIV